jgi:hypothetical protein
MIFFIVYRTREIFYFQPRSFSTREIFRPLDLKKCQKDERWGVYISEGKESSSNLIEERL